MSSPTAARRSSTLARSPLADLWWRRDHAPLTVGDRLTRFRDPAEARAAEPFPAYVTPTPLSEPRLAGFGASRLRPRFARDGRTHVIAVDLPPGTALYATGEQAGPLRRDGSCKVLWNSDSFDYDDGTLSLYQSHPFVLCLLADGRAAGVLFETTRRLELDLRRGTDGNRGIVARSPAGGPACNVLIIERDTPQDVVRELARLTGRIALPPRWALDYHQCRWSYEPADQVREIAAGFRERGIPCGVIWLDIDYMDGFRCFTTDPAKFKDMPALVGELHAQGFKVICMIDPGLKTDPEYHAYAQGRGGPATPGHFVRDAGGGEYHGEVWPGLCAFPDFTRAGTRRWWAGLYSEFMELGFDGVWNDMNEPAVFKVHGKTMPEDNLHDADADLGGPGTHAKYHNVYGMFMARATREGIAAAKPDKRPFVLTRASFLGGQRDAAMWTGDNAADWRHYRWSIGMTLNMGLSGQPVAGPDIGGFKGNTQPELFARWMGVGALLPFARGHKIKDARMHEPWELGPRVEAVCKAALERRSRLLPYLYTLFREASLTGVPVMRPAFFADPSDPRLRSAEDLFLIGEGLLVRADLTPVDSVLDAEVARRAAPRSAGDAAPTNASLAAMVNNAPIVDEPALRLQTPAPTPLPRGVWREWDPRPDQPRLFVKAGHIIPVGPVVRWHDEKPLDPLTLIVSPDEHGHAVGTLYEDAGDGLGYQRGEFVLTTFRAHGTSAGVVVETASREGRGWAGAPTTQRRIETVVLA